MTIYTEKLFVTEYDLERYKRLLGIKDIGALKPDNPVYKKYQPKLYSGESIGIVTFPNRKRAEAYLVSYGVRYQINVIMHELFDMELVAPITFHNLSENELRYSDYENVYVIKFVQEEKKI